MLTLTSATLSAEPGKILNMPKHPEILLVTFYGESIKGFKQLAQRFEQQTGIHVNIQTMPKENYGIWLDTQYIAGSPPELVMRDFIQGINQNGRDGVLIDLSQVINQPNPFYHANESWNNSFKPTFINKSRDAQGKLWAIPFSSIGYAFFYNKNVYNKFNLAPPKTWDEFIKQNRIFKKNNYTPVRISYVGDQQEYFISDQINNLFFRAKIPDVNIQHAKDWKFDPLNPDSVVNENLSLEEKIIAFEKGTTDPAKAPEYHQLAKLMLNFSSTWNDNFDTQIGGQTLIEDFLRQRTLAYYASTGEINKVIELEDKMKIVDPKNSFEIGFFPLPEFTKTTTGNLNIIGGINQRVGVRTYLSITKQKQKWREQAALLFLQFIMTPDNNRALFKASNLYDLPTIKGVTGPAITEQFNFPLKYADMNIGAAGGGYDGIGDDEWARLDRQFLSHKISLYDYLQGLSKSQRNSLLREANSAGSTLDTKFIRKQLHKDFK